MTGRILEELEKLEAYFSDNADLNRKLSEKHKGNKGKRMYFLAAAMAYDNATDRVIDRIRLLNDPTVQTEEEDRIDIIGQNGNDGIHY